ncbi:MAG: hypothetical protein U9R66_04535 [Thermodesulfobacteriota bacterium]|nr:hypothetical protein [Thermodesulfobacteriota bacterium]
MENNLDQKSIQVLVAPDADSAGIGDFFTPKPINLKTLKENLRAFTMKLEEIIPNVSETAGYELSEVTVNVCVSASGELQLVGVAKGKGEISGGFSLNFRKIK